MEKNLINTDYLAAYMGNSNIDEKYSILGLKYNPFPRSGTANINDNDSYNRRMLPIDSEVTKKIMTFTANALLANQDHPEDKFQSCVILGDYGSGKTQLLMYIKSDLREIANNPNYTAKPYVIYIDNPGVNLLEFIGNIISRIGEENLRKYLWNNIISTICNNDGYKTTLNKYLTGMQSFSFEGTISYDPYAPENLLSYKQFLTAFVNQINTPNKRKNFDKDFQEVLLSILYSLTNDSVVSYYFYEFISSDYGVNKTWEALINGNLKSLNGKEAKVIKFIVQLVKEQGYTDFFILVDEFEDITEGRLSKIQLDNYIYNLRTLLDEHREWGLFFSMNPEAYKRLRRVSPPLADRIATESVVLSAINIETSKRLIENYISIADGDKINPFSEDGIERLGEITEGNARRFLILCFRLVEFAAKEFKSKDERIDTKFINKHVNQDGILL